MHACICKYSQKICNDKQYHHGHDHSLSAFVFSLLTSGCLGFSACMLGGASCKVNVNNDLIIIYMCRYVCKCTYTINICEYVHDKSRNSCCANAQKISACTTTFCIFEYHIPYAFTHVCLGVDTHT